jgi:hypothetical protein
VLRKDGQEWELMDDDEPTEDMSEDEMMFEGE